MQLRSDEFQIGDHQFVVTQLPAFRGWGLMMRLLKILGESFADMMARGKDPSTDQGEVTIVLMAGLARMEQKDADALLLELMSCATACGPETNDRVIGLGKKESIDAEPDDAVV